MVPCVRRGNVCVGGEVVPEDEVIHTLLNHRAVKFPEYGPYNIGNEHTKANTMRCGECGGQNEGTTHYHGIFPQGVATMSSVTVMTSGGEAAASSRGAEPGAAR